jgi:hypothetical protein
MAGKNEQPLEKTNPGSALKPENRHRMVAEAAYYKAEKRGFRAGNPEKDWVEAEAEVESSLAKRETRPRNPKNRSVSPRTASP